MEVEKRGYVRTRPHYGPEVVNLETGSRHLRALLLDHSLDGLGLLVDDDIDMSVPSRAVVGQIFRNPRKAVIVHSSREHDGMLRLGLKWQA